MMSVAALVGSRVAAFELGIACQVFGLDRADEGLPVYDFSVCAPNPGLVPTTSGFSVEATHDLDHAAGVDLVVIPASPDLHEPFPLAVGAALQGAANRGATLLAICTGAFALAEAGLLDGRRATTHWQFTQRLAREFPAVTVEHDVLYVDEGPIVTSAGASAGIDAALHVVRRIHGAETANAVARRMVMPAHRAGGQAQYIEHPVAGEAEHDVIADLLDQLSARLDQPHTVADLAAQVAMSPRTFARRFRDTTGTTPHRWLLDQRLRHAERLLETTTLTIDVVARRSGFGSGDTLRHHFAHRRGTTPGAHRRAFGDRGSGAG